MPSADNKQILLAYSNVLLKESKKGAFIAESKLPHSVSEIKRAIVETLLSLDAAKIKEAGKQLLVTYTYLAHFIPDEDAQALGQYWKPLESDDEEDVRAKYIELQANEVYMKLFQSISLRVEKIRNQYRLEIEQILTRKAKEGRQRNG